MHTCLLASRRPLPARDGKFPQKMDKNRVPDNAVSPSGKMNEGPSWDTGSQGLPLLAWVLLGGRESQRHWGLKEVF